MITLYDLQSNLPGKAISPFGLTVRYILEYKGLPHKTQWVAFTSVEQTCKEVGIPPTTTKQDGSPHYTVPAIHDSSTGAIIADSFLITQYLDKTYPDTPRVIPQDTDVLQIAFATGLRPKLGVVWPNVGSLLPLQLNSEDKKAYQERFENRIKRPADDFLHDKQLRQEVWKKAKLEFDVVDQWFRIRNPSQTGSWVMGETLTFADFSIAGAVRWMNRLLGEDSDEWLEFAKWHDGRWAAYLERLKVYSAIA